MARVPIQKKDGSPTVYFWSDKDGSDPTRRTVYKQTAEGVKRMKGISFNANKKKLRKD